MGDVNLEIKLGNLDERVIKIEESGGGSGGDGYITSVSNDFNVVNKKLSLSNDVTTKLSKLNSDGTLNFSNVKSKPTTLSGYGITDSYTKTEVDAKKIEKPASANDGQVLTYNATSDMWEAKDSQGGGDWVLVKTQTGATAINIDTTKYKEFLIRVVPNSDNGIAQTIHVLSSMLIDSPVGYRQGYYQASNNFCTTRVDISKTSVVLNTSVISSGNVTTTTTISVYAK